MREEFDGNGIFTRTCKGFILSLFGAPHGPVRRRSCHPRRVSCEMGVRLMFATKL